ncbi:carbohydrate ABC transporter permease [Pelagibacterium lacus]|uniref:Sugar ABC transporter permease n=1 Tax=Pelagibacterium lacus TaxID=2282655 RepID=A0A369W6Q6_9HYPH|nr:sugar ABC transporter permease [Pelagibacterium lacus]RDE08932.1 sugar ABC transporter permease [Pelagibacterium lacus]
MPSSRRPSRFSRVVLDGPLFPFLMILPALIVLGLVIGLPILEALRLSFDTIALRRPAMAGTYGFHNYLKLFTDPRTYSALWLSCLYMAGTVVGSIILALTAALLTRRVVRFSGLTRLIFLLPWTVPAVVTALVWGVMYDGNFGVINRLIDFIPFIGGHNWLVERQTALASLIVAQVWNEFPMAYVFFLAGLKAIPDELYEAAAIDRANALQQFLFITLPQLRYIMAVIVILVMIMGFKSFPIIYILTGGGPAGATETLTILTYNTAFRSLDFSYAATLGILAVLASILLVLGYLKLLPRSGNEGTT